MAGPGARSQLPELRRGNEDGRRAAPRVEPSRATFTRTPPDVDPDCRKCGGCASVVSAAEAAIPLRCLRWRRRGHCAGDDRFADLEYHPKPDGVAEGIG